MQTQPYLIELKNISDSTGSLTVAEFSSSVPFLIKRVYWIKDVPDSGERGGHAHKTTEKVWVCLQGSIKAIIEGPDRKQHSFSLHSDKNALYVPAMHWVKITFSGNAIFLCLASKEYDENDYIKNHKEFVQTVTKAAL